MRSEPLEKFLRVRRERVRRKLSGPDRRRLIAGSVVFALMFVLGLALNISFFRAAFVIGGVNSLQQSLLWGALPAFVMVLLYLPIPSVLDRFDPEPLWCVVLAFLWGAVVATGVSAEFHALAMPRTQAASDPSFVLTVIVAPVVEELMKGSAVAGFFYFLRREFDGVVDGVVYAMFTALGFATVENVGFYARAALEGRDIFAQTFIVRGLIAPFGHPLYTSMIGLGFGIARESTRMWLRVTAPIVGTLLAVLLHALWNLVPRLGADIFVVSLIFWLGFVVAFSLIVAALVVRKGRTIRRYLRDEVVLGNLSEEELTLVTSAFGRLKSYFVPRGEVRRRFIRSAARLALSKWHVSRAARRNKRTFSLEFIAPLRAELSELREKMNG